mmetsp:Transcript_66057/g.149092  ORF Transcript_66057/g.149092 Transcript_66057/m.149092 type:complete len:125 (+) Transcript_66057:79-453(+)
MDGFDLPPPEPAGENKLDEFNRNWEASLASTAAEEEAKAQEMKAIAQAELTKMKEERDELRDRNSSRNREHEQVLCEQIDADIGGSGNPWERVGKMVDLQVDASKDAVDTSRMRQIFIKKKNES